MTQGKTICQCGRDDIHSSKDCWTIENRIKALNELAKQAQELDMGYDNEKPFRYDNHELLEGYIVNDYIEQVEELKTDIKILKKQNEELKEWKVSALMVLQQWNGVSDYINKNGDVDDLGKPIPIVCLKYLIEREMIKKK